MYRLRQGQLVHPNSPYGYRYRPISEANGECWEIEPLEAAVVGQIYNWYTQAELTITEIVDRLQALGVSTPPRGQRWGYSTVQAILTQPAYTGRAYYNRTLTQHEAVGRAKKYGRGYRQSPSHQPRPPEE